MDVGSSSDKEGSLERFSHLKGVVRDSCGRDKERRDPFD